MINCTCTPAAPAEKIPALGELYQRVASADLAARVANRRIREIENSPAATMAGRELISDLAAARAEITDLEEMEESQSHELADLELAAREISEDRDRVAAELADRDEELEELEHASAADYSDLVAAREKLAAAELRAENLIVDRDRVLGETAAELRTENLRAATATRAGGQLQIDRDRLAEKLAPYSQLGATPSELLRDMVELANLRAENLELLKLGASYADRYDRLEIDRDRLAGSLAASVAEFTDLEIDAREIAAGRDCLADQLFAANKKLEKIRDLAYSPDPA